MGLLVFHRGGGGGGGTPGGSTKQVQYNNAGAFGGAAGFEWQGTSPNVLVTAQAAAHVPLATRCAASPTANRQEWQDSAGTPTTLVSSAGYFRGPNGSATTPTFSFAGETNTGWYLKSAGVIACSTQGDDRIKQHNGAGNFDFFGDIYVGFNQTNSKLGWHSQNNYDTYFQRPSINVIGAYLTSTEVHRFSATTQTSLLTNYGAAVIGSTVRGAASQSANLQEWQNSSSTVLFAIEADGDVRTSKSVAATTPGAVVKKLPIYDIAGALLGYVPLYDAIT